MSQVNPSAVIFHSYFVATAVVTGLAFGAAWSLIPLGLGLIALVVTEN